MRTNNPLRDFSCHDFEEQEWLESRPTCYECGEPITEDYAYMIDSQYICHECMEEHRVYIEEEI